MPVLKEVSVTYGGKLNLGDFNSAHIEATISALPEEGETPEQVAATLLKTARELVRAEARQLYARRSARVDEIFAGLPVEVRNQISHSPMAGAAEAPKVAGPSKPEVKHANQRVN